MNRTAARRSGRRGGNERIRELIALLGSLSKTGDTVTIDAISTRLGIDTREAHDMMDIVCQASGEDFCGLLISSNEDETEYTLQFPGITGKPVRLTSAETIALVHALDVAGIDEDDPLRKRLETAFWSPEVDTREVRHALGAAYTDVGPLFLCARSLAEGRLLEFEYKGMKDSKPRVRHAVVRALQTEGDAWYVLAYDTDIEQERTFRVDRMSDAALGKTHHVPDEYDERNTKHVSITFSNTVYYHAFDWPGLRITRITEQEIQGVIPYYGDRSTWLIRRICAGNSSITVNDVHIMQRAQEYAQALLGEM